MEILKRSSGIFEHKGYFREYWVDNKFIGSVKCQYQDEKIGYEGRKTDTLKSEIILNNGKKIKEGTVITTMIYPLCGKLIKPKN